MHAILIQHKIAKALNESFLETMTTEQKKGADEISYSTIILHLADDVLRKVNDSKTTFGVRAKLEQHYMVKSLLNKIYLLDFYFGLK